MTDINQINHTFNYVLQQAPQLIICQNFRALEALYNQCPERRPELLYYLNLIRNERPSEFLRIGVSQLADTYNID
jgi:hypothetical protein